MPILKLYDESTHQWVGVPAIRGEQGIQGVAGPTGPQGFGIPSGGYQHQVLVKQSSTDYDMAWELPTKLIFTNVAVASSAWAVDTSYTGYNYKADVSCPSVVNTMVPEVIFGINEVVSGNFAPICESHTNKIRIFAKAVPSGSITIPTLTAQ